MKVKDLKHTPVFWDNKDRASCVLGNVSIYEVDSHIKGKKKYSVNIWSDNSWGVSQFGKLYNSKEDAKKSVQNLCNEYLQQALSWLDNKVKFDLDI